jgi:hypothetical protein
MIWHWVPPGRSAPGLLTAGHSVLAISVRAVRFRLEGFGNPARGQRGSGDWSSDAMHASPGVLSDGHEESASQRIVGEIGFGLSMRATMEWGLEDVCPMMALTEHPGSVRRAYRRTIADRMSSGPARRPAATRPTSACRRASPASP